MQTRWLRSSRRALRRIARELGVGVGTMLRVMEHRHRPKIKGAPSAGGARTDADRCCQIPAQVSLDIFELGLRGAGYPFAVGRLALISRFCDSCLKSGSMIVSTI
jgi:hypothetical protein